MISSYEVVLRELRDRRFNQNYLRKFPSSNKKWDGPTTLREAKGLARALYTKNGIWEQDNCDKNSKIRNADWTSDVAFSIGDSLQQLGFLVATGAIPLGSTLLHAATAFVDDWLLCAAWIKDYQLNSSLSQELKSETLHFHRRHAEWLALLAIAHLRKSGWNFDNIYLSNPHIPTAANLKKRLLALTLLDADGIPAEIRLEVARLTNDYH